MVWIHPECVSASLFLGIKPTTPTQPAAGNMQTPGARVEQQLGLFTSVAELGYVFKLCELLEIRLQVILSLPKRTAYTVCLLGSHLG